MPQSLSIKFTFKKVFAALLLLFLLQRSAAQIKYGVTAGVGKTSLYKFPFSPEDYNRYSSATSWCAGLTADLPLSKNGVNLFGAALYNQKGYTYLMKKETGVNNTVKDSGFMQNVNYADININLRKRFIFNEINSFFAGTGPVLSFFTGGKEKIAVNYFGTALPPVNNTNSKLVKGTGPGKYTSTFFSWSFAAGFEINNFSIFINACIPLTDYYQDAKNSVEHKIKSFGINVGYALFSHVKKEFKKEKDKTVYIPVVIDSLGDDDGDGIVNVNDKCPGHKGTLKYFGCPVPDTDGDGINDDDDKCITVAGTIANNGCPSYPDIINPVKKDTVCYTIYFEPGKSILRTEAYNTLAIVVKLLKENPKLVAVFTGHTDNVGSVDANFKRSLGRASVSADHVASYYIGKDRLTIVSSGNKKPAADLNDPMLQWKNRRVEICVFENK
jgi:outer membrane protein OmpA-like peptidoglycan-associated protein